MTGWRTDTERGVSRSACQPPVAAARPWPSDGPSGVEEVCPLAWWLWCLIGWSVVATVGLVLLGKVAADGRRRERERADPWRGGPPEDPDETPAAPPELGERRSGDR